MKQQCFAYVRVSTAKQGERGVSLQEQRDAILRYVQRSDLKILQWFEERETAAKRGRPVFGQMLTLLRKGKAHGLVIHKIDRSARNLKDWADLGELIDAGVRVHFANESLDLNSRGGRLSADIQAVVAADYIRNLREETRKGFYGRLKQGLYPLPAPLGYLDQGKGKPKTLDPEKAPLVRQAFQLYGEGGYTLNTLLPELNRLGLRNRRGGKLSRTGLSVLLNNPFYIGLIRLKSTGETFPGGHEPLLSKALFDRVQRYLQERAPKRKRVHDFLYRRFLRCQHCGYALIGELQKGNVYYRCHTPSCPTTTVREDTVDESVLALLLPLRLNAQERAYVSARIEHIQEEWRTQREETLKSLRLRRDQLEARLDRLTDAFVEGLLERCLFERRNEKTLLERQDLDARIRDLETGEVNVPARMADFLELAGNVYLRYESGNKEEKRDLLRIVTSNREVDGREPMFTLSEPFQLMARRPKPTDGAQYRARPRTLDSLVRQLKEFFIERDFRPS